MHACDFEFAFIQFWTKQMKYIFSFIVNIIKRLDEYLGKCSVIIDLSAWTKWQSEGHND